MVPQRRPQGDWRSDEKAIEAAASTGGGVGVAMFSPTSGEVGRKFRELIQDDGRTASGKTRYGRTTRVLSRDAAFHGSLLRGARRRRAVTRKGVRTRQRNDDRSIDRFVSF